ncbi:hypothetical protein K440DRAFT_646339 [Wilcoxina mikolae CBS 423.85]|nr:hypothetical protein K440DRAFT_646339 [Wilcoxina mikolae CBS 423.85]
MASNSTPNSTRVKSQYHHFIPRFILRNYADLTAPAPASSAPRSRARRGGGRRSRGQHHQQQQHNTRDGMLKLLNLQTMELEEQPLSKVFGLQDMYRDFDRSNPDQHRIEQKLSALESKAGTIIANARNAFTSGKDSVGMIRGERDTLRKFLFIMMYRSKKFYRRYNHQSADDYKANDRVKMLAYMKEKGFKKPIDVWFANLEAILDLQMDAEQKWAMKIMEKAYPDDAAWFFKNMQMYFMSFCTPKDPKDEFLLTENVYGIFEGCNTNEGWTDHHLFAPVSSRLMIVLRSNILPTGIEDNDEEDRKQMLADLVVRCGPAHGKSMLEDLPVERAMNNYSKIVNRKPVLLPTKIRPENHKFYFRFFGVDTSHVQKINIVMIEEAYNTSMMLYREPEGFKRALEAYLLTDIPGFKRLANMSNLDSPDYNPNSEEEATIEKKRVAYIEGLEKIARELGSTAKAQHYTVPRTMLPPEMRDLVRMLHRIEKLGGSVETAMEDLNQAYLMMRMADGIDIAIRRQSPEYQKEVRGHRRDFFCSLPLRTVWYFLKRSPMRERGDRNISKKGPAPGPEDVIVDSLQVFHPASAARIMYYASSVDNYRKQNPDFGLVGRAVELNQDGFVRIGQQRQIVFDMSPAPGIALVELYAKEFYSSISEALASIDFDPLTKAALSEEQRVELATRREVRSQFKTMLAGVLPLRELEALETVMFDLVYPSEF